jgi:serine/threonine-protein kinase/endoribonuclease IRE1
MTEAAKKRTSDGTAVIKKVGQLSFSRNDVMGSGSFGTVYKGKFMGTIDVAIKRILREKVTSQVETVVMTQIKSHPNVLRYFCVEEDEDFVYVN